MASKKTTQKKSTVAIMGCGLIGASVAAALKHTSDRIELVGIDLPERLSAIEEASIFDRLSSSQDDPAVVLAHCQLVILAMPVQVILETLPLIGPALEAGTLVIDTGSTKTAIMEVARRVLPAGVHFIGGHPIAGSERSGVEAADPLLFRERVFVLCPQPDTPPDSLLRAIDLVEDLKALPVTMEPEEHDQILAMVSHVPHLVAIALVNAATETDASHKLLDLMAGPGFLDLTRIAASDFSMWASILQTNRPSVEAALDQLERSLAKVRTALGDGSLAALWETTGQQRRNLRPDGDVRVRKADLREQVDHHDERLLKAMADRMQVVRRIGKLKSQRGEAIRDPERERLVSQTRREWAKALGLPDGMSDAFFELIMDWARRIQR